jgi:ribosome biogenesis GTPase A
MLLNLLSYDSALREEAIELLRGLLPERSWNKLKAYYKIPEQHFRNSDWLELVESIAVRRGRSGDSDDDIDRTARQLIRDFQHGRFGRLSVEDPATAQITSPLFSAPASWDQGPSELEV